MTAFASRLQRLEEQVRAPAERTRAEEIELEELILGAYYGVQEAAVKILEKAEAGKYHGPDRDFPERFMQKAEEDLIHRRKILREMTGDDDAAWEQRLAKIEAAAAMRRSHPRSSRRAPRT